MAESQMAVFDLETGNLELTGLPRLTREETTIRTDDKLAINAQIGYRIYPRTLVRAGLFESSGGFAIDHAILVGKRPLRLTFEAYDFNRRVADNAHLRLEGRYFINSKNGLYVPIIRLTSRSKLASAASN